MMGFLILILAGYLIWTGSLPLGKFPYFRRSPGLNSWNSSSPILMRSAGVMILMARFLPDRFTDSWHGDIVMLSTSLLLILVGLIVSLSGRAL